jgi:hypothetical protein
LADHQDRRRSLAGASRQFQSGTAVDLVNRVPPSPTAPTQLIKASVDICHASISTTEIYTHVSDHALHRVVSDADVLGRFVNTR